MADDKARRASDATDPTYAELQAQFHQPGESDRAFAERVRAAGGARKFAQKHNARKGKGKGMGGI